MRESLESYVARQLHIREDDIFSKSREKGVVKARQICMAMLREFTPRSYPNIGRRYGGRTNASALQSVRCFYRFYDLERDYRAIASTVRAAINAGDVSLPVMESGSKVIESAPMYEEHLIDLQ